MKSSVEEAYEFIKKFDFSPEMLTLEYNANRTRAKVVFNNANIRVSNFMGIYNANKFIDEIRKRYYGKSSTNLKRIK
jgi:phosphoribosylaminoimidazole carboxylase (NCAIR synthetase)